MSSLNFKQPFCKNKWKENKNLQKHEIKIIIEKSVNSTYLSDTSGSVPQEIIPLRPIAISTLISNFNQEVCHGSYKNQSRS